MLARTSLAVLRNVANVLAENATERRAVVVVSEGYAGFGEGLHDSREPLEAQLVRDEYRRVLEAAAFANVAVYGIDRSGLVAVARGMKASSDRIAAAEAGQAAQVSAGTMLGRYYGSLGLLALNTGGLLTVDTNDIGKHITQMMRDSRQYYRLATSSQTPIQGRSSRRRVASRSRWTARACRCARVRCMRREGRVGSHA
jgi:VWFA-related protein